VVQEDGFGDVAYSSVHESAVDCVVQWRVANGATATAYRPAALVDRGQMASFIARLVERSGGTLPAPSRDWFGDDGASAHRDSIDRLAEAGIVGGKAPGRYAPLELVTRAQMAAFLVRAHDYRAAQAGLPCPARGRRPLPRRRRRAAGGRDRPRGRGRLRGGYPDGTYRPRLGVARDQMASFLARVLDLSVERGLADRAARAPGADGDRLPALRDGRPGRAARPHPAGGGGRLPRGRPRRRARPAADGQPGAQPRAALARPRHRPAQRRRPGGRPLPGGPRAGHRPGQAGRRLRPVLPPPGRVPGRRARRPPGWEVKLLHVQGLRVGVGARVEAGVTVVAAGPRLFPFRSQVDDHTAAPHWPHVHVEVVDLAIPDRPSGGGGC
jgi:hypothetical protein